MIRLPQNTALIIIDVQQGFNDPSWGARNNPDAEQRMAALLAAWRDTGRPVFHIQHLSTSDSSPLNPRNPGCAIKEIVQPLENEPVVQKHVNSAFIGTSLEDSLHRRGIATVAMVGLTTPHCVSTSARMAANLGFEVYLPGDAIAAFEMAGPDGRLYSADEIHSVSLATLHGEFATVVDAKTLLDAVHSG
ncbi:MAG: cysteine hydrolase family protein [Acidobacteriaceae bacterium]